MNESRNQSKKGSADQNLRSWQHVYENSNPLGFDSDCKCGGKHRDSQHGDTDKIREAACKKADAPAEVREYEANKDRYPELASTDWRSGSSYKQDLIDDSKAKRNWKALPASFEHDAVKAVFSQIKGQFKRDEIKQRIAASRAVTFEELQEAAQ